MQIVAMEELNPRTMNPVCESAMQYIPKNLRMVLRGRQRSSLLYILRGKYHYTRTDGSTFEATAGDLVYLPRGGVYQYEIGTEEAESIQMEFDFWQGEEPVVFRSAPEILISGLPQSGVELLKEIVSLQNQQSAVERFRLTAAIWQLCAEVLNGLRQKEMSGTKKRIAPAVEYLEQHFSEEISVKELAQQCFLSESQLRRLFRNEIGMSPVEYKNRLRMQAACRMLKLKQSSVSEIAGALGYSSVYSFSQEFRKAIGVSPRQYSRQENS